MPGLDHSGPEGQGPRTGRQMGNCKPRENDIGDQADTPQGGFWGRGRGPGRGMRRGWGGGPGRGWRRGPGWNGPGNDETPNQEK